MEYLQESGASIARRRRRRRAAVTLTIVPMLIIGTLLYVGTYIREADDNTAPNPVPSSTCHPVIPAEAVTPSMVTLNVYNATDRVGLASSVAESLQEQGFNVATITDDPLGKTIRGVGEVRRGQTGAAGATLAMGRLARARVVTDERTDDTVDFVLGNEFKTLSAPPKVEPPPEPTPEPTPAATPSC